MKLMVLVLVRRLLPMVGCLPFADHYAYQSARGAKISLPDLVHSVTTNRLSNRISYVVGLDSAGAFDSVSHVRLVEMLRYYRLPMPLCRFTGARLTQRAFRVRLTTPLGVDFSRYHDPTRGVPQGGVFPPLLCLLHMNGYAASVGKILRRIAPYLRDSWTLAV